MSESSSARPNGPTATAWYEKGQALLARRNVAQALECFQNAHQLGFDPNQCAAARWDCWMLSGQFELAWAESDTIAASHAPDPHRLWDGRPWNKQRVMLRCLHGLGDTIHFIRFAPLLRQTSSKLLAQTHPQLTTLLEGVPGIDAVTTWGPGYVDQRCDWDVQIEVTELPRAFRTTLASLPAAVPYIRVPQSRVEWAAAQFPRRRGLRIGLCWQAGPWDPARSIPLNLLTPLITTGDYQIFSLQKGAPVEPPVRELETYAADVRDTAAFILNLDLVITVDTVTAHLAGALGQPVWILLPFTADWRWMLERRDTPWYPTARLFRQHCQGDWSKPLAEVAQALHSFRI